MCFVPEDTAEYLLNYYYHFWAHLAQGSIEMLHPRPLALGIQWCLLLLLFLFLHRMRYTHPEERTTAQ